jgi:hypothetical protein
MGYDFNTEEEKDVIEGISADVLSVITAEPVDGGWNVDLSKVHYGPLTFGEQFVYLSEALTRGEAIQFAFDSQWQNADDTLIERGIKGDFNVYI